MTADGRGDRHAPPGGARVAIMQPYLFPYIGYYQLCAAVDRFLVLDDVTYIRQGWINRNRLEHAGTARWFTLPLAAAGSNRRIADLMPDPRSYPRWRRKFLQGLAQDHGAAPGFPAVEAIVRHVLPEQPDEDDGIAAIAMRSVDAVLDHLGIVFRHERAADILPADAGCRGAQRVVELCRRLDAAEYVNAPGGTSLYEAADFERAGLRLSFLRSGERALAASAGADGTPLSMLHVLLHRSRHEIIDLLGDARRE